MDGDGADVVRLHPERDLELEDAPISRKPRDPSSYCTHRRVMLNQELHRVECRECGKEVDPFVVLARYASEWEHYHQYAKEAQRRAGEAGERLKEILRLEQNARARLGRLDSDAAREAPKRPWGHGSASF